MLTTVQPSAPARSSRPLGAGDVVELPVRVVVEHEEAQERLVVVSREVEHLDVAVRVAGGRQRTYKVHLDGFNLLPCLTGEEERSPRRTFVYFSDDGDLLGLRYDNWKIVSMEQRAVATQVRTEPFVALRVPKLFNLRLDPFERADLTVAHLLRPGPAAVPRPPQGHQGRLVPGRRQLLPAGAARRWVTPA